MMRKVDIALAGRSAAWCLIVAAGALATGCGEDVGVELVPIAGMVTLDGQPLAEAQVVYRPQAGRPSVGQTDAEGRYELFYTDQVAGVLPGTHAVIISTLVEPDSDSADPDRMQGRPERVPRHYNSATTLTVEIPPDHSEPVDWDLKSEAADKTAAR